MPCGINDRCCAENAEARTAREFRAFSGKRLRNASDNPSGCGDLSGEGGEPRPKPFPGRNRWKPWKAFSRRRNVRERLSTCGRNGKIRGTAA